ncbi:hypothetical protein [Niabella beijingensis]|uniref:hypothetical protein n=1 Tax=Niabella beijingensis TaxID=2872700 RepID=UPI001CBC7725|nr:hypothetical protein [Niabella beijingensis]MBZ4188920.1 hypothetical protein [Niabella beijingensis]
MKITEILRYTLAIFATCFFISCSKKDGPIINDELKGLQLVTTISNATHKIEFYTVNGRFQTGYNKVYFQIRNMNGTLMDNATASWIPEMNMTGMKHSCPYSSVSKKENSKSTYTGFIVFQMAGNDSEYWDLILNYSINGTNYSVKNKIPVSSAPRRVVESFQGSDGKSYILAMVEPSNPRVATNDMTAVLYRMETMMSFPVVENYKIKIDPRMPGMGNHSSPNNTDLIQGGDKMYQGKLSLTMTGYWKINLMLQNDAGAVIKGEAVTDTNKSSSIYFELEF